MHTPPVQLVPSATAGCWQLPLLQLSAVQALLSLQLRAVPEHVPPPQTSPVVQPFPSSHDIVLFVCVQLPLLVLQPSVVHTSLSLQLLAVPLPQDPPAQRSPMVQALPSSQDAVLFECVQLPPEQPSAVHGLESLQSAAPAHRTHAPPTQKGVPPPQPAQAAPPVPQLPLAVPALQLVPSKQPVQHAPPWHLPVLAASTQLAPLVSDGGLEHASIWSVMVASHSCVLRLQA